jgi:bifunctional UDP-N-acetylglucosamine pyrophosphorylase/glucosamine-1-phosphate N-acetyltransferase
MAGGLGTRMRSATPKHLHPLLGRRMVLETAVQAEPLGTGDAVRAAAAALASFGGDVLVLNGDVPALTSDTLLALLATHRDAGAAATVLSFEPEDPAAYGRVVRDAEGRLAQIVEARDAADEELALGEVNSGIYAFRAERLWAVLERLEAHNVQGELYLTDTLGLLAGDREPVAVHVAADPLEVEGVNTRAELAAMAAHLRDRINRGHMLAGVTIVDPKTTWIEASVELEPDVVVHPFTYLRGRTRVETGAVVGSHVEAVDAVIGAGASVGPFCYLRPGTALGASAKAGTFVEIKNSNIGDRTKVPHLSYIGDADIGDGTNVGAGAITANFPHRPGLPKGRTRIGSNVRTAIHNGFVAPVTIGDDAWIAAGSIITDDVPDGALAIARARQENKEGYVERARRDG